jgi:ferredoxin
VSLIGAAERFAAMDRSTIALDSARCLHSVDRNAKCDACFALCPVDAITPGKPPVLDAERCEGCLACLPACPVGAYSADDAVPALLNSAAHIESGIVELLCALNPQPEKGASANSIGVRVRGCLAGLGTGAYVALAPFGLEQVVLRTESCDECQWAPLHRTIDSQVERAQEFLSGWEKADSIGTCAGTAEMVTRPTWNADNPPLSRRELFRMLAHQGQVAMARAMDNGVRTTGRHPGRDHIRMLGGVQHLPAPQDEARIHLGEYGFATVSVSDACSACGACGRACPTQALTFEKDEDGTTFTLKFSARLCIACDLCAKVCVPQAVTVNHDPGFAEVFGVGEVKLLEGELIKCRRCGALTAKRGDDQLCDLCEYRRTHPFGSMLPPGLQSKSSPAAKEPG